MTEATTTDWCARAVELGAGNATWIATGLVVTSEWVRMKCLFGCDGGDEYRCCPPRSPKPHHTRRLLDEFDRGILLGAGPFRGEDDEDEHAQRFNDAAVALERELFLAGFHKSWTMGAGPCERCEPCELEGPCVDPDRARPSMEGCGIDVFTTVRNAGWQIEVVRDKDDEYRFFALVLVD